MGLFAERRFSKEDYIGVYLGKFDKKTDPHKGDYAYQLGNLDAETGLGGKPYMGLGFLSVIQRVKVILTSYVTSDDIMLQFYITSPVNPSNESLMDY